jgi:CRP-like cAMP-binding protein
MACVLRRGCRQRQHDGEGEGKSAHESHPTQPSATCQATTSRDMIIIMLPDIVERLKAMGSQERSLGAGAYLFHLGDPVVALFVVLGGRIQLVRHQEDGNAIVLQRAGPGEVLAEASCFSERYHCDAIAMAAARVRVIPKRRLRERFRQEPEFAEAWATHVAHEVQHARLRSEILALRTVASRLDAWFAWHGGPLPPKGEWKQIAHEIAVSPEALYRELARRRGASPPVVPKASPRTGSTEGPIE